MVLAATQEGVPGLGNQCQKVDSLVSQSQQRKLLFSVWLMGSDGSKRNTFLQEAGNLHWFCENVILKMPSNIYECQCIRVFFNIGSLCFLIVLKCFLIFHFCYLFKFLIFLFVCSIIIVFLVLEDFVFVLDLGLGERNKVGCVGVGKGRIWSIYLKLKIISKNKTYTKMESILFLLFYNTWRNVVFQLTANTWSIRLQPHKI